jgi:hypothetical protein
MIFAGGKRFMMRFVANFRTLLVGLWLGAALFFSFAVAPSAFAVLPSRELAGSIVNQTLTIVNYSGLVVGLILLASSFVFRKSGVSIWLERIAVTILTIACVVGQFVVGAKLHALREQIARPIDELSIEDPLRIAFNDLHRYSIWLLMTAMIAALVTYFFSLRKKSETIQYQ